MEKNIIINSKNYYRFSLLILLLISNHVYAWNVLYSSQTDPGKARSQIISRNLNNNGSVTGSVWLFNSTAPVFSHLKFLEVDDNGNVINQSVFSLRFPNSLNAKRIEIHRILINRDSNTYVVLGTAHNPNVGFPSTRSFLLKLDNTLNLVQVKFLDEYFNYYDFSIAPITGQIICVGTSNIFQNLKVSSRRAVIATTDQNFICQGYYLLPMSYPTRWIISRFDNIKTIKCYKTGETDEDIFIAGHITRDSIIGTDTQYIPEVFAARLHLNPGGNLTHLWFSIINSRFNNYSYVDQVTPCDLIFDPSNNLVAIINSSTSLASFASPHSHLILLVANNGYPVSVHSYEGPAMVSSGYSVHEVYGQSISLKSNGKYSINGWVDNYFSTSPTLQNRYNFHQVDFDPTNQLFDSIRFVLGNSKAYLGIQPKDFYGHFCDTGYSEGLVFVKLGPYWTNHAMTTFVDSNGVDVEVVTWISTKSSPDTLNHQLRIWSSKAGQGDNGFIGCDVNKVQTVQGSINFDVISLNPNWQFVPCVDFFNGDFSTFNINFDKELCNGQID